jgi:hypothetical protein
LPFARWWMQRRWRAWCWWLSIRSNISTAQSCPGTSRAERRATEAETGNHNNNDNSNNKHAYAGQLKKIVPFLDICVPTLRRGQSLRRGVLPNIFLLNIVLQNIVR